MRERARMVQLPVSDDGPIGSLPMLGRWLVCFLVVRGADAQGNIHLAPGDPADGVARRFGADVGTRRLLRRLLPMAVEVGSVQTTPNGIHMTEWSTWNRHALIDPWRRVYRAEPGRLGDASVFARGALIYLHKVVDGRGVFEGVAPTPEGIARALLRRRGGGEGWKLDRALLGPLSELVKGRHVIDLDGHALLADFTSSQEPRAQARSARIEPNAGATPSPPEPNAGATPSPPAPNAGATPSPPAHHMSDDASARKDIIHPPSVYLSKLSRDVRDDGQAPPQTVVEKLVLTMPDPTPPRRRRAVPPAARPEEAPPDDTIPGARALYDVIRGDERLRAIVADPSDFAMRSAVQFCDLNVAFVARDAAEYLARPGTPTPRCGRAFLRNQFTGAMQRKFGLLANYPYTQSRAAAQPSAVEPRTPDAAHGEVRGPRAVASDPIAALAL